MNISILYNKLLIKINSKLRKNLEEVSSKVDTLLKKASDNATNYKKKKNTENSFKTKKSQSKTNQSPKNPKKIQKILKIIHKNKNLQKNPKMR